MTAHLLRRESAVGCLDLPVVMCDSRDMSQTHGLASWSDERLMRAYAHACEDGHGLPTYRKVEVQQEASTLRREIVRRGLDPDADDDCPGCGASDCTPAICPAEWSL